MSGPKASNQGQGVPPHRFYRSIAYGLMLAVTMLSLASTAKATYTNNSGNLPGMHSTGEVVGVAAAAAAVVVVVILVLRHLHKKRQASRTIKPKSPSALYVRVTPKRPPRSAVPATKKASDSVTVKSMSVAQGGSGAFTVSEPQGK